MIRIQDKKDCCGCTACESICAHSAIKMVPDPLGFVYPKVDESMCVDCGLCNKVCSFHGDYNRYDSFEMPLIFGCRHRNINELQDSQSGALAAAIMEKFLEAPGVVYGVAYDSALNVVHKRATTLVECKAFKGSKYVQSDVTGIFRGVVEDLKNGQKVLFFGTPCQIAGLKSFVPKKYQEELLLVDIICHAVPSPAMWRSYREWIERKYHKRVVKTNFRNKEFGWHSHIETFTFIDHSSVSRDSFKNMFYNHLIVRPSCSSCYFTNLKRVSDITIGDFWGWENTHSIWNDNKGVSLALVNSPKGELFFNSLNDYIDKEVASKEECMQPQLIKPIDVDVSKLQDVEKLFSRQGYYSVAYKYGDVGFHHVINKKSCKYIQCYMPVNKTKKVGIVTFHFPHNYGAMLQAYSMQEKLLSMGYDASIIDYEPYYHKQTYDVTHFKGCFEWSPVKTLRHIIGFLLKFPTELRRYNNFESFKLNRMRLTPYSPTSDYSEFDYILLGSDQIWNQALTNNCFDGPYYGEGFKSKVFSYAASSKYKEIPNDIKREFKNKLKNLFAIGVREENLKVLLQPLTDKNISVNLDPSLIVDASTLSKLKLNRPTKSKYVLVYELRPHSEVAAMAKNYADQIGAKVITLVAYFDWKRRFSRCDQEASPEKFLSYIKNAECIFTTSFHGTAFSIVFQKSFYVVRQNNNSDLRIESLMKQLDLVSNFVAMESRPTSCSINYQEVAMRLEALRANSINYLKDCLNS